MKTKAEFLTLQMTRFELLIDTATILLDSENRAGLIAFGQLSPTLEIEHIKDLTRDAVGEEWDEAQAQV